MVHADSLARMVSEAEILQAAQADWLEQVSPKLVKQVSEYDPCQDVTIVVMTFDDGHVERKEIR